MPATLTRATLDQSLAIAIAPFEAIPVFPLGEIPESIICDEDPRPYRRIIARRAIEAAYDDPGPESIADLLADLRHLCDACHLDFAQLDTRARENYLAELSHGNTGA